MYSNYESIREIMASWSDESLVIAVTEEADEYEPDALKAAEDEIKARNIDIDELIKQREFQKSLNNVGICRDELISFSEIIHQVDYLSVEKIIKEIHPEDIKFNDDYAAFFQKLLLIEPAGSKSALIKVEKQEFDADDPTAIVWTVSGLDMESGKKLDLEQYSWNEWLSFYIRREDLKKMKQELFTANCLFKMTLNGFTDEDVENNLKMKTNGVKAFDLLPELLANKSNVNIGNVFTAAMEYKNINTADEEVSQIRPWVRFWARMLDNTLVYFTLFLINRTFLQQTINLQIFNLPLTPFILALAETILLHFWGTTPGKWLLRIKICNQNGSRISYKKAFRRSIMVWALGEGIGLYILQYFANLVAYFRLSSSGKTYWDEKNRVNVIHEKIGFLRVLIFIALLISMSFCIWLISYRD